MQILCKCSTEQSSHESEEKKIPLKLILFSFKWYIDSLTYVNTLGEKKN